MGRPREFDIDQALDRAMNVFWAKGYEGASLQDLLKAMKIARGSLYKAFDDKHSIYLAALDRYDHTVVQQVVDALTDKTGGDGVARIRRVLAGAREAVARRRDRRGCFMCNAAVDQAPMDPKTEARVMAMMKRIEKAFAAALKESKQAGQWPARQSNVTARLILNCYMGLRVLAKAGYAASDLQGVATACLQNCGLNGKH